jgi:hypothetical protein
MTARGFVAVAIALALLPPSVRELAAQQPPPARWREMFTVANGIGTGGGGALDNGTTILQVMRASAAILRGGHGAEVTALRLQPIFPPPRGFNDLEYANPEGDALVLSYVRASRNRSGTPSVLALGGGVIRRETSEAGRTRDTWLARLAYDTDPFWTPAHFAAGVTFHGMLSSSRGNSMVAVTSLGVFFRWGPRR